MKTTSEVFFIWCKLGVKFKVRCRVFELFDDIIALFARSAALYTFFDHIPKKCFSIHWIKPRLGLGVYIRNASETCLFATRGKAPVKFHAQPNWLFAPQQPRHSEKPAEQFAIIERLSDGPYLELFARRRQPRWDCWGNEIDSDIAIPGYQVPTYSSNVTDTDTPKEV